MKRWWERRAGTSGSAGPAGSAVPADAPSSGGNDRTRSRPTILNGSLSGDISLTGALVVGDRAVIRANIRADRVIVRGEVIGDITAFARIEVKPGARVTGDLIAPEVVVDGGALFEGNCRMRRSPATPLPTGDVIVLRRA